MTRRLPGCKDSLNTCRAPSRSGVRLRAAWGNRGAVTTDPIALLVEHGEEHGCVHMTELYELVQKVEMDEEEIETLLERLETHGVELTDDCSRAI
jgi:hypothetical protein